MGESTCSGIHSHQHNWEIGWWVKKMHQESRCWSKKEQGPCRHSRQSETHLTPIPLPSPNAESQAFTRCFHFSQCLKGLRLHPGQNTVHCFPRLQQPYPADQPGLFLCFVVASLLCYTYSNFSSALNVALLQQLIISRHRGVYSWADSVYSSCPRPSLLSHA